MGSVLLIVFEDGFLYKLIYPIFVNRQIFKIYNIFILVPFMNLISYFAGITS